MEVPTSGEPVSLIHRIFARHGDGDDITARFVNNELLIDARLGAKLELKNNELRHLPKGWDTNLDERALEIVNENGNAVFQLVYGASSDAIVNGIFLRIPGQPDILVRATPENAAKVVDLLNQFGFADASFKESDFTKPEQLIQLGRAPNRIDLLTSITGVTTDEALAGKVVAELDGIPVFILSKDTLIRNKRAVGRPQDIADLDMLES